MFSREETTDGKMTFVGVEMVHGAELRRS